MIANKSAPASSNFGTLITFCIASLEATLNPSPNNKPHPPPPIPALSIRKPNPLNPPPPANLPPKPAHKHLAHPLAIHPPPVIRRNPPLNLAGSIIVKQEVPAIARGDDGVDLGGFDGG
ncbi:hypothetical protein BDW68DRAFT_183128 [Aspergillus falconensis]